LHARQQTLAMLDTTTGEVVNATLRHEGNNVREFYSNLPRPVRVGIEATGSMQWFVNLLEELGIECLVVTWQRFERPNYKNKNMRGFGRDTSLMGFINALTGEVEPAQKPDVR
jgi:hypothetical protein